MLKKIIVAPILIGLLTACGGTQTEIVRERGDIYTPVGTYPVVKEGETDSFSVFAPLRTSVTTYDPEINQFSKRLEELTGVTLEYTEPTSIDKRQKFNIMMTGGDYTDVILDMWLAPSELLLYAQQGIFVPLNDLIDKYAPNIKKALDENPVIRDTWTLEDGNMYCIPRIGKSPRNLATEKMWINQDWLNNLGLEVPTTTDEFYEVLKAFKEQDANGNGDPDDEIPFTAAMVSGWGAHPVPYLLNAFIPAVSSTGYFNLDENDKVYPVKATDEWKEFLRYMNKMYTEGLIDPLMFTQTKDQLLKLGSNPEIAIAGAIPAGSTSVFCSTVNVDRWTQYIPIAPLTGPAGVKSAHIVPDFGGSTMTITNACENPEVVMRVFDYMFTEQGALEMILGMKGAGGYDDAPKGAVNYIGEPAKYIRNDQDAIQDISWNRMGSDYQPPDYDLWFAALENPDEDIERILYISSIEDYIPYGQDPEKILLNLSQTTEESRRIVDITALLDSYLEQAMIDFIIGNKNVDEDWEEYLADIEKYGIYELAAIKQAAYDRK
ncbi:extracellular solute-binding protein [Candidatus Epulonipiscium viviparus]|uniref:extracellular solute-binding protein n=1 Tax=Candidatus Epulonipiscium viviparus TaxID=420336 RepID=UPI00273804FB|nr:extracellular solute-binding protein [Candidatus Epulopiscium viviparus]